MHDPIQLEGWREHRAEVARQVEAGRQARGRRAARRERGAPRAGLAGLAARFRHGPAVGPQQAR